MNREVRVLFIRTANLSFIEKDLGLLRKEFIVKVVHYSGKRKSMDVVKGVVWADISFSWFAGSHAALAVLLSRVLRKRAIVVTGGYDVANEPSISYGIMRFPKSRDARIVKFALDHADLVLPFSDYAAEEVLGINQNTNLKALPLACDTEKFVPGEQKENLVLTVCMVVESNIARKGLKAFVESARHLPKAKFVLVGPHIDDAINYLKAIAPPNVEFTGYVPEDVLIRWYQRAKVYCQLSYQEGEGAGGALGEAMACECVPVVSEKAVALRETVGDCGFYVPYGDIDATVEAIKKALCSTSEGGREARGRMIGLFSMGKREKELSRVINEVLECHK